MSSEDQPQGDTDVALLRRVSRIVNSDLSVDELLGQIVVLTAQVSACDACIVYLLESATGDFVLRASQVPHPRIGNLRMQLGEGVTGWVAQNHKPILNGNPSVEPGYLNDPTRYSTLRSALAVPLEGKAGLVAVLALYRAGQDAFTKGELEAVEAVGARLGLAIESMGKSRTQGAAAGTN